MSCFVRVCRSTTPPWTVAWSSRGDAGRAAEGLAVRRVLVAAPGYSSPCFHSAYSRMPSGATHSGRSHRPQAFTLKTWIHGAVEYPVSLKPILRKDPIVDLTWSSFAAPHLHSKNASSMRSTYVNSAKSNVTFGRALPQFPHSAVEIPRWSEGVAGGNLLVDLAGMGILGPSGSAGRVPVWGRSSTAPNVRLSNWR